MIAAFYTFLHAIGFICTLPLSRKVPARLLMITGFVWGLLLWIFSSIIILILGVSYTWLSMGLILLVFLAGAVYLNLRRNTLSLSNQDWLLFLVSIAAVAGAAIFLTQSSYVYATTDSFNYIFHGKVLARSGLVPWAVNSFTKLGAISSVIQMSSHLLPGEYLNGYQTILGLILVFLIFFTLWEELKKDHNAWTALAFSGLLVLSLTSVTFLNHIFYIHSNLSAGIFLFLALYLFWQFYKTGFDEWAILGMVSLTAFSFTRIEGPLYTTLILLLLISVKSQSYKKTLTLVLPYAVLTVLWHIFLLLNVSQNEQLSPTNLLLIIAALGGLTVIALVSKWLREIIQKLPDFILPVLTLALVMAIFIEPDHMITSLTIFWQNLTNVYFWNWTWFVVLAGLPVLFIGNRDNPENKLLSYIIGVYILTVFLLVLARNPYRVGKTDSANRLMLALLPSLIFVISTRIKAFFPGKSSG